MPLAPIQFTNDHAQYITPTWDELDRLTFTVAAKIRTAQQVPDLVVALAKGAWPMSRSFVDYLGMNQLASLGVKFYSGINERLAQPEVYQDLPIAVAGKKIILFDDVADTGISLRFAKEYLESKGAAEVKTATLFLKPHSEVKPDFYAALTSAWIIFPFELREMMELLSQSWQEKGLPNSEMKNRFQQLHFPEEICSYYLPS